MRRRIIELMSMGVLCLGAAVLLTACSKSQESTMEDAAKDAGKQADKAVDEAKDAVDSLGKE